MSNYFIPFEIAIYLMFITLFLIQFKKPVEERKFFVLFAGLAFGIILEIGDIAIWHTYSYGNYFLVYVMNVPLAIGVAWAVLFQISMLASEKIGNKYRIPIYARSFIDVLIIFSVDIVLDVVSVANGGWNWLIAKDAEWFGVPYENFIGWMSVALIFSLFVRIVLNLERRIKKNKNIKDFFKSELILAIKTSTPFISYILLVGFFIFQAAIVNTFYFIKTGRSAYIIEGSWLNPNVIYDSLITQIKEITFVIIVILLLLIVFWILKKHKVLEKSIFKKSFKKSNWSLMNFIQNVIRNAKKDSEITISFFIIILINVTIFIVLLITGLYKNWLLFFVQLGVIIMDFYIFLIAFNCSKAPEQKQKIKSRKINKRK